MTLGDSKNNAANKNRKLWIGLTIGTLVIILVIIGVRLFSEYATPIEIGQAPGDFVLTTFSGQQIKTADLHGKVVLINFWSSWCVTCDEEAILLEQAWQQINSKAPGEVAFLGVAYMDTEPDARSFLEKYGVTYPNGPDLRGEISDLYQIKGVPETYVLDRNGTLQYIKFGPFLSLDEILEIMDPLLNEQTGNEGL